VTYKATARQIHFRAQEGSSSVRVTQRGYGGKGMSGDPIAILPTLKEQLDIITARMKELAALIAAAPTYAEAERLRGELGAKTGQHFNLRKIVYRGCQLAKTQIFMSVAKQRLPHDLYEMLVAEALEYWSADGFADMIPEPNKQERRRASRKLAYREWKSGKQ
jgi:hypothetical protein